MQTKIETPEGRGELQTALEKLMEAREEIAALEEENEKLRGESKRLREMMDEMVHEDEVVITTKHHIENIEIYFKRG